MFFYDVSLLILSNVVAISIGELLDNVLDGFALVLSHPEASVFSFDRDVLNSEIKKENLEIIQFKTYKCVFFLFLQVSK